MTNSDLTVQQMIAAEIKRDPLLVRVGMPLARVEKTYIAARIQELAWVGGVSVKRNWISGTIKISVMPRVAIAQIESAGDTKQYLDEKLRIFSAPSKTSEDNWKKNWGVLPTLYFEKNTESVRASVVSLMNEIKKNSSALNQQSLQLLSMKASAGGVLDSRVKLGDRTVEVGWGANDEIALKVVVLRALLLEPKNARITRVDLTSPRSPIVK